MSRTIRPGPMEFSPYYARYIERVPDGDVVETLRTQIADTVALVASLSEERGAYRYAPDKWSIREVLGHLADTERIMAYRALRIARRDITPLPGYDENAYVANARFDSRSLHDLADDLTITRRSTLSVLAPLNDDELARGGTASEAPVTVRALAWIIAGHERHHLALLHERYL